MKIAVFRVLLRTLSEELILKSNTSKVAMELSAVVPFTHVGRGFPKTEAIFMRVVVSSKVPLSDSLCNHNM